MRTDEERRQAVEAIVQRDKARAAWVPGWYAHLYNYGVVTTIWDGETKWETTKIMPITRQIAESFLDASIRGPLIENLSVTTHREIEAEVGKRFAIDQTRFAYFLVDDRNPERVKRIDLTVIN